MSERTIFTAVSFEKVPLVEIGPLAQKVLARGWEWTQSSPDWVAHFRKDFPENDDAFRAGEDEIREVMGIYYVSADEMAENARRRRQVERIERLRAALETVRDCDPQQEAVGGASPGTYVAYTEEMRRLARQALEADDQAGSA